MERNTKSGQEKFDVIVVGGGASGMMAAGRAGELGLKVLLLEKNKRLGEKLRITGGGRCNVTNAEFDHRQFLSHYGETKDFLFSPFSQFGVKDTFTFFETRGLPLVVEARLRAFPNTQKAEDVNKVMEDYVKKNGVTVKTGVAVSDILCKGKKVIGVSVGLPAQAGKIEYLSKTLILATGGLSHPETGSTGDGFRFLARLGHKVRKPTPDVVPLASSDKWVRSLAGVSLSFMKVTFYVGEEKAFSKKGKILFTHFGLSGPLILNSARQVRTLLEKGKVRAVIDAFPDTDIGALEKTLIKVFDANKNKLLKNIFKEIAPRGTAEAILSLLSEVNPETKVHSITKEERRKIVLLLKNLPVSISGLMSYDRAVVSDGGISLEEIDMRTMSSKFYPNLFLTGDLLDINRQSGGYSLQLCWTTGHVAGSHTLEAIEKEKALNLK